MPELVKRMLPAVVAGLLLAACASAPSEDLAVDAYAADADGEMTMVSAESLTVCDPKVLDERAMLADDCINRIDGMPSSRPSYNAVGREIPEQRSLCNHMFLPRCRRKY